jgi:outer membrane usher protein
MTRTKLARAILFCLSATPALGWPAEVATVGAGVVQAQTMVVRATLNTEDKGDVFVGRTADLDFLVKVDDLKAMGFRDPAGTVQILDGEPHLSLRSVKGLSFAFDEKTLSLNISAEPQLLGRSAFDLQGRRRIRGLVPTGSSAFFNYALNYAKTDSDPDSRIGFAGEVGWRYRDFLLLSDANTVQSANGHRKLVRLSTSITHDDNEALRRTVIGDFFTQSRDLSNGVNLGGLSVSKVYGLDPYLIRFPMQSVSGNVALPSDLEVYLDGQKIRTERLKPGEFELRDILAYGGARNVQLLLRDAFGRVQQLNYSFYFSDQPLRQGLHEYSYNLGAFRRSYGTVSNNYGLTAFSLFHRYGVADAITLGLRAEGNKDLLNAGPLATVVLGSAGVLNLALAASTIEGNSGAAAAVNYNYQARSWNFSVALRRDSRFYASLGDPPIISNRKFEGNVSFGVMLPWGGNASLSHAFLATRDAMPASSPTVAQRFSALAMEKRRLTTLGFSVPIVARRVHLTASLSHIKEKQSRNEIFVGLNFILDKEYSAASNVRGNRDSHTESLQLTRNQPVGEGLGYMLSADHAKSPEGRSAQLGSSIQYNAPSAILRGEYGRRSAAGQLVNDYRLSGAGGIAFVGGEVVPGRPVSGSFGIVKVGDLADVEVSVNGQPIGRTNAQGKIFVPTLTPHVDNDVTISPESVPMDYSFPTTIKQVAPSLRSGVLIDFSVTKIQAFTGKLMVQRAEARRPVALQEFTFIAKGKPQALQTGAAGDFYVENLEPGIYPANVLINGKPCLFDLVIPRATETFVELGELVCRGAP